MKFFIKTFGCRVNIAESDELREKLRNSFSAARAIETADFIIIRACAVTAGAEQGVRQAIRNYKRKGKLVFVVGCFMEKIPEADGYFKSDAQLLKFLSDHFSCGRTRNGLARKNEKTFSRARAFVKIQFGCDFHCAFCVTRLIRGRSKQANQDAIIRLIKEKSKNGFQEVVLTGTNILLYKNICVLINKVLRETTIPRIRFGSIDPRLVTERFVELFGDQRLMPHLHLSLQSGSEKILKKMGRPTKIARTKDIVKKLRAANLLFNFSADIIVGYPGETEEDFKKSLKLAKELQLCKIHYFPYSSRPGTPANRLQPLPPTIIKNRLAVVAALNAKLRQKARKRLLNKHLTVFFEYAKNNIHYGYTPNFIRVKLRSKDDLTEKIKEFIIKKSNFTPFSEEGME